MADNQNPIEEVVTDLASGKGKLPRAWLIGLVLVGGALAYLVIKRSGGGPAAAPAGQVPTDPAGQGDSADGVDQAGATYNDQQKAAVKAADDNKQATLSAIRTLESQTANNPDLAGINGEAMDIESQLQGAMTADRKLILSLTSKGGQ